MALLMLHVTGSLLAVPSGGGVLVAVRRHLLLSARGYSQHDVSVLADGVPPLSGSTEVRLLNFGGHA